MTGRRAVVTGAASGIGLATAELLRERGVSVLDVDLAGGRDVTRAADRAVVVADAGPVDYLVNAAGTIRLEPLADVGEETWRETFAVNAEAPFFLLQALASSLRDGGAVVNVASAAAKLGGARESAVYAASKAALLSLTRSYAHELAPRRIRVNAICPGIVETPMQERVVAAQVELYGGRPEDLVARRLEAVPLRRPAEPRECAEVIAFLLSDAASYMTAQAVNVSGGMVTW